MDKIIAKLKEYFDINDIDRIDFDNIDRNNPPIFGPEDIFEDIYDEEVDSSDLFLILILLLIPIAAIIFSVNTFFECIGTMKTSVFCMFNLLNVMAI